MFIGRENELATMRKLYDSNKFQMVIIYGRRRIGKTTLISKFVGSARYLLYGPGGQRQD